MDYNKMFSDLASLRMMKKELEAEIEAKEAEIKELMDRTCVTELIGTEHKATYKEVISKRIDTTLLKKEMPTVAARYTKESPSMRFTFA